jgi:hypothetical protein
MVADPIAELAKAGVRVPKGLRVTVLLNTPNVTHMIVPEPPAQRYCTPELYERLAKGNVPAALRLGPLLSAGAYQVLVAALSGVGHCRGKSHA